MYSHTSDIESDWVPWELESQLSLPAAIVVNLGSFLQLNNLPLL
jgi:hypothetical protein